MAGRASLWSRHLAIRIDALYIAEKASLWSRYLAIPVLLVTSSVATLLLVTTVADHKSSSSFAIFVAENATVVGQVVHMLSRLLGTMMVYTLCELISCSINLSARSYLHQNPITLDRLKLLLALCFARVDWSLPVFPLGFLSVFVLASSVPAILWTGALTPVPSTKLTTRQVPVPSFSNWTGFTADVADNASYTINNPQGTFSWLPYFNLQGSIIQAARDASNNSDANNGLRSYAKLDRTGFVYTTRSFGMGSGVGLVDAFDPEKGRTFGVPTTGYKFVEQGLLPNASCICNQSSAFFLEPFPVLPGWSLHVFNAIGFLPNNATSLHAATGLGPDQAVAMAAGSGGDDKRSTHFVALATGNGTDGKYGRLNNVQCEIRFEPKNFSVEVNSTLKAIAVSPLEDIEAPPHAKNLTVRTMAALDIMSGVFDTTIWVSIIGDTFLYNIANVEARPEVNKDDPRTTFTGVKDSLESMLDNVMLAYSSAQLMLYDNSHASPVEASVQSIAFGNPQDVYLVFAANIIICVAYAFVLFYISRRGGVEKFNFTDIKTMIVAASAGGHEIAAKAEKLHIANGTKWVAAENDQVIGQMQVRIDSDNKEASRNFAVVLAEDVEREAEEKDKPSGGTTPSNHESTQGLGETRAETPQIVDPPHFVQARSIH